MENFSDVLIIDTRLSVGLAKQLIALGYAPVTCDNQEKALDLIKHHDFAAVFLYGNQDEIDALEFALNTAEISPETPVFVIDDGILAESAGALRKRDNVLLVTENLAQEKDLIKETIDAQ
jgi:DNA-binding NtrC family response regulator